MASNILASIDLEWDESGNLSHSLQSFTPANDYQQSDALALSVALLTGSQLGILAPNYALELCQRILRFLDGTPLATEVIHYPLSRARIDLHQKGKTIVCTFHPTFLEGGTMEPEEGVRRLLANLPRYVCGEVIDELAGFLRAGLLIGVFYYLSVALPKGMSGGVFTRRRFNQQKVQFAMLDFCESLYPHWRGGLGISPEKFASKLREAHSHYRKATTSVPR